MAAIIVLFLPAEASSHGGATLAEGQSGGVTVIVQGSPATAPSGEPVVDLATTLAGPGTGEKATVVYYVRPQGRQRSIRVETDRDDSGIRHAEIKTAGRGEWHEWDVSAIVELSSGKRLRVSSTQDNPPGPEPAAPRSSTRPQAEPTAGSSPSSPLADASEPAVDDISGEDNPAPAWVVPSVLLLVLAGVGAAIFARRR